jgi:SAM-dependent methyltransferase
MAHKGQISFCLRVRSLFPSYFKSGTVADIGAASINGNNRHLFGSKMMYMGYDLWPAKNVNVVMAGKDIGGTWDMVISTETLEHDHEWRETVANMCRMVKDTGMILITCATDPRKEHGTFKTDPADSPATATYYGNTWPLKYHYIEIDREHGDLYYVGFKKKPKIRSSIFKYIISELRYFFLYSRPRDFKKALARVAKIWSCAS